MTVENQPQDSGDTEHPELDYRFTLANERTFLAWIRTALGLLAAGVAVHTLVQPFHHAGVRRLLSLSCIVLAVVLAAGAYTHWRDVQDRMVRGEPLGNTMLVPILAGGIAIVSIFAAIATVWP
ncbi:YidH family protein [Nocardia sp. NPDC059228]|uniref:YidH family protein n=1 Tax=Nocardia sp. NPDC059228 TaxID=3346777 RepID=UPI0036AE016C